MIMEANKSAICRVAWLMFQFKYKGHLLKNFFLLRKCHSLCFRAFN